MSFDDSISSAAELLHNVNVEQLIWEASPQVGESCGVIGLPGLPVVAGAAQGVLCMTPAGAEIELAKGNPVIYARHATSIDDMSIAKRSAGLVTSSGGPTCHAAIIARMWVLPTVVGVNADFQQGGIFSLGSRFAQDGSWVTLDSTRGLIFPGCVPIRVAPGSGQALDSAVYAAAVLEQSATVALYGNADTAADAARCFELGAAGIGVARTEHMFMESDDVELVRDSIWGAANVKAQALTSLRRRLTEEFSPLLGACRGHRLVVRLLDPPLHEFMTPDMSSIYSLFEHNPMMGVRGVRLGFLYEDVYHVQVSALLEAYDRIELEARPKLAVLLPFTNWPAEVFKSSVWSLLKGRPEVELGAMVETPESVYNADALAAHASFLSVGTNDLVQFCLAMSRDDVSRGLIPRYLEAGIIEVDPLTHLSGSRSAIGLLEHLGRLCSAARVGWGICGEHGGDPQSLQAILPLNPSYVSVSPGGLIAARLEIGRHTAQEVLAHTA